MGKRAGSTLGRALVVMGLLVTGLYFSPIALTSQAASSDAAAVSNPPYGNCPAPNRRRQQRGHLHSSGRAWGERVRTIFSGKLPHFRLDDDYCRGNWSKWERQPDGALGQWSETG
jgi:hypothetical protein